MSIEKVHLRKLFQFFYADRAKRISLIRADIREVIKKESGGSKSLGGDFFSPFWADAKSHVAGSSDLLEQTKTRIARDKKCSRLYPLLAENFLTLWNEKIGFRNEKYEVLTSSIHARWPVSDLRIVVKIENMAAVQLEDGSKRVIYPYFSEDPALPIEGVRLGFWVLAEALPDVRPRDIRILDILRRSYFRPSEVSLVGNEREIFIQRYKDLASDWTKLRREYD